MGNFEARLLREEELRDRAERDAQWNLGATRYCERCHEERHGEHLCADIAKRLARRERQVQAVLAIWAGRDPIIATSRKVAEEIVQKLSELGVQDD